MFWDNWFKKKESDPVITASSDSVREILKLNDVSIFQMKALDPTFILPSDDQVMDIVYDSDTRYKTYIKGKFECEEFSYHQLFYFLGKGYAFGYAIISAKDMSTTHQLNIYINSKNSLMFLEPQTGKLFDKNRILKIYSATIV